MSGGRRSGESQRSNGDSQADGNGRRRGGSPGAARVARGASSNLVELLQRPVEGVISLQRLDDGWRVGVEVLELRRIPETSDVLAEYEVDTEDDGELIEYRRVRRYLRGAVEAQQ